MTHRQRIADTGRLTAAVIDLLAPHFPDVPLGEARVRIIERTWWRGRDAATDRKGPKFTRENWESAPAWALLVWLTHELEHWAWLRTHRLGTLQAWLRPRLARDLEANAKEMELSLKVATSFDQLSILDREADR